MSRREPGAVLHDMEQVTRRCVAIAAGDPVTDIEGGEITVGADSICVHGDSPGPGQLRRGTPGDLRRHVGEDLADVTRSMACDQAEMVRRRTEEEWTVAFCGFAAGVGYAGSQFEWDTARRDNPRTQVPAASVALAGEYSAVYPRVSPGRLVVHRPHRPSGLRPRARSPRRPSRAANYSGG